MRKYTRLFFSVMSVCLLLAPAVSYASIFETADFTVSDSYIMVGESFDVSVSVTYSNGPEALIGFGFDVDPSLQLSNITFTGYQIGSGFDDFGSGNYINGLSDPWSPDMQGPGQTLLATLSFTAISEGSDTLEVFGEFDNLFYGLFYELSDVGLCGSVNIEVNSRQNDNVGAVPIPAPVLLLGTGLCGLGVFKRKIRI